MDRKVKLGMLKARYLEFALNETEKELDERIEFQQTLKEKMSIWIEATSRED